MTAIAVLTGRSRDHGDESGCFVISKHLYQKISVGHHLQDELLVGMFCSSHALVQEDLQ